LDEARTDSLPQSQQPK
jgi:hypothetical protein